MPTRRVAENTVRLIRPLSDNKRVDTSKRVGKQHVAPKIERIYDIGNAKQSIEFVTVLLALFAQPQTDAHQTEVLAEIDVGVHYLGKQFFGSKRVHRPAITGITIEARRRLVDAVQG